VETHPALNVYTYFYYRTHEGFSYKKRWRTRERKISGIQKWFLPGVGIDFSLDFVTMRCFGFKLFTEFSTQETNVKSTKRLVVVLSMIACVSAMTMLGCKSKESKTQDRTLHGTVATTDVANGSVSMNWFNEKIGKPMIIGGQVTEDTEIYIDGKVADLGQLREGDEVVVDGYTEKGKGIFAKRISVTRNSAGTMTKIEKPAKTNQTTDPCE
jgi:cytochrome c-type biogenesis protein CcmE